MRLILILLSCGVLASGQKQYQRLTRGTVHGVDIRQILSIVEPGFNLNAYNQPYNPYNSLPYIQQFSIPFQPSLQPYVLNLPPILNRPTLSAAHSYEYEAPKPQSYHTYHTVQYNAPEERPELSSVAVSAPAPDNAQRQALAPAPQQQYNQPAPQQQYNAPEPQPQQQYNQPAPQREYNAPAPQQQQYQAPAAPPADILPPQKEYGVPNLNSNAVQQQQQPQNEYGSPNLNSNAVQQPPQNEYGSPNVVQPPQQDYGIPNLNSNANRDQAPAREYNQPKVEVSAAVPIQSYGLPSSKPAAASRPSTAYPPLPAPNSAYRPPTPNSAYGSPTPGAPSATSAQGSAFGLNGVDISRDVSIHVPAPDIYEQPKPQQRAREPKRPKKQYKIIFIKAPVAPTEAPEIPEVEPEPEQKTLVYVLVQKPEKPAPIVLPKPAPAPKSKPEVYFVKYRQAVDDNAERGQPLGQALSSSSGGGYDAPAAGY